MSKSHKKLNNYAGTLNYNEEHTVLEFEAHLREWATYCVYGREVAPKTGQKHLQVFAQSYKMLRTLTSKKHIDKLAGCHLAVCYAPAETNKNYCMKDGKFKIFGTYQETGQGARNDIRSMMEDIKNGADEDLIISTYPDLFLRYKSNLQYLINKARATRFPMRRAAPRMVTLYTGPSGSGKTSTVLDMIGDKPYYRLANVDNTMWWTGYDGQDIVVLDDFKGGMKLNTLLGILDPWYNTDVAVRPGHLVRMPASKVYITSTMIPEQWYPGQDISELKRRITDTLSVCKHHKTPHVHLEQK